MLVLRPKKGQGISIGKDIKVYVKPNGRLAIDCPRDYQISIIDNPRGKDEKGKAFKQGKGSTGKGHRKSNHQISKLASKFLRMEEQLNRSVRPDEGNLQSEQE